MVGGVLQKGYLNNRNDDKPRISGYVISRQRRPEFFFFGQSSAISTTIFPLPVNFRHKFVGFRCRPWYIYQETWWLSRWSWGFTHEQWGYIIYRAPWTNKCPSLLSHGGSSPKHGCRLFSFHDKVIGFPNLFHCHLYTCKRFVEGTCWRNKNTKDIISI